MKKECVSEKSDRVVPIRDVGRKINIVNRSNFILQIIKYDGCEVSGVEAADYLVRIPSVSDHIIELKGRNIEHALDQISSTIERLRVANELMSEIFGAVSCKQVPKSGCAILKKRESIKRKYGVDVAISSSKIHYCIESCCFVDAGGLTSPVR